MSRNAPTDQRGDDIGLEIGKAQDQIGLQVENFWDVGRCKGRDARLFAPGLGRPHAITRDANDAILLAEQIEGLDGLLGQTDDALGWKHPVALPDQLACRMVLGLFIG